MEFKWEPVSLRQGRRLQVPCSRAAKSSRKTPKTVDPTLELSNGIKSLEIKFSSVCFPFSLPLQVVYYQLRRLNGARENAARLISNSK